MRQAYGPRFNYRINIKASAVCVGEDIYRQFEFLIKTVNKESFTTRWLASSAYKYAFFFLPKFVFMQAFKSCIFFYNNYFCSINAFEIYFIYSGRNRPPAA